MYDRQLVSPSRDPIGYEGSQYSIYQYTKARSTIGIDPYGLQITYPGWPYPSPPGPIPQPFQWPTFPDVDHTNCKESFQSCVTCAKILQDWIDKEKARPNLKALLDGLDPCPCSLRKKCKARYSTGWVDVWLDVRGPWTIPSGWSWDKATWPYNLGYHPGATYCIRTSTVAWNPSTPAQQCCFDKDGDLITSGRGAGTPDINDPDHVSGEVAPYNCAMKLDGGDYTKTGPNVRLVDQYRPPNNGNNCPANASL